MKITPKVITLALALCATSQAATSITGVLGSAFKANDATTNIPSGALVMIIADSGSNGFLNLGSNGSVTASTTAASGNTITVDQASIVAGGNFGGDVIVTTSLSGSSGSIGGIMTNVDITPYVGLQFAVVWFNATPATLGTSLANQYFGMIRLADWTLPASDSGATFTMSSTDSGGATSFYSTSASITTAQLGAGGFFTGTGVAGTNGVRAATFQIVEAIPEPSAAVLGALGAFALLRRRRN